MKYVVIIILAVLLFLSACSSYTPSESVTDDERAYVEKAITSLFEGQEAAKPYLTEEYYNELTKEGYWEEIKKYELVKLHITNVDKFNNRMSVRCRVTSKEVSTNQEQETGEYVDFEFQNGTFLITLI